MAAKQLSSGGKRLRARLALRATQALGGTERDAIAWAAAVELARDRVAALLPPGGQVIFTSGATEAINLAMRGLPGTGSISVSAIEHAAVLDTARALGRGDEREPGCGALDDVG